VRATLLLLIGIGSATLLAGKLSLILVWDFNTGGEVKALAFNYRGTLGVASYDACSYVLSASGEDLYHVCNSTFTWVSAYGNLFAFMSLDNYVYLINSTSNGTRLWKKVEVSEDVDQVVTLLGDGMIACQRKCSRMDFNGTVYWTLDVGLVETSPKMLSSSLVLIADSLYDKLYLVNVYDGSPLRLSLFQSEEIEDVATCKGVAYILTSSSLYVHNFTSGKYFKVAGLGGQRLAISPTCSYVAVADGKELTILQGTDVVYSTSFENDYITALAWGNALAVGFKDGRVAVFSVETEAPLLVGPGVPAPLVLPVALSLLRKKLKERGGEGRCQFAP